MGTELLFAPLFQSLLFARGVLYLILSYALPGLVPRFNATSTDVKNFAPQPAVLITGSSTGIGKEMSLYLASLGYAVFACVRKQSDGDALVSDLKAMNKNIHPKGKIMPLICDVVKQDQVNKAKQQIEKVCSTENMALVSLVSNAGVHNPTPVELMDVKAMQDMYDVNVFGALRMIQAFLPVLRKTVADTQYSPRVVFTSSIAGVISLATFGPYSSSKHALEAIVDALRQELKPQGIAVSSIQPGMVYSPLIEKSSSTADDGWIASIQKDPSSDKFKYYSQWIPLATQFYKTISSVSTPPSFVAIAARDAIESRVPATRYCIGIQGMYGVQFRFLTRLMGTLGDLAFDSFAFASNWFMSTRMQKNKVQQ
ncbi:hypothetical protein MP228_004545 [Amoeboaphelidium protococcarum]|nr:hypothetical protein MP228_004545 [Amoeboaphelidium protococcarum]